MYVNCYYKGGGGGGGGHDNGMWYTLHANKSYNHEVYAIERQMFFDAVTHACIGIRLCIT